MPEDVEVPEGWILSCVVALCDLENFTLTSDCSILDSSTLKINKKMNFYIIIMAN